MSSFANKAGVDGAQALADFYEILYKMSENEDYTSVIDQAKNPDGTLKIRAIIIGMLRCCPKEVLQLIALNKGINFEEVEKLKAPEIKKEFENLLEDKDILSFFG